MRRAGGNALGKVATFGNEAIVRERRSPPGTARRRPQRSARRCGSAPAEEAEAEAFSFIVRVWKHTRPTGPECRGWVEHVQSGQRTFFLGLDQVLSIIAAHIGVPQQRGGWWRKCLMRWRDRTMGWLGRGKGGMKGD
jgi:hypothetical protein